MCYRSRRRTNPKANGMSSRSPPPCRPTQRSGRSRTAGARWRRKRSELAEYKGKLPPSLKAERDGAVAILRLNRPEKRNAFNEAMVIGVETFFSTLPDDVRVAVIVAEGEHFSAGLD